MARLPGVSDRDAGWGAKIAFFFMKRRFVQMTGRRVRNHARPGADVCARPEAVVGLWKVGAGGGQGAPAGPAPSGVGGAEVGDDDPLRVLHRPRLADFA